MGAIFHIDSLKSKFDKIRRKEIESDKEKKKIQVNIVLIAMFVLFLTSKTSDYCILSKDSEMSILFLCNNRNE